MSAPYHANLELILVDWIGAHRDRDLDRISMLLDEEVEQRWIDGEVYCGNRGELIAWKASRPALTEYALDAVEVVRGDGDHVVLGVHGPHLEEVGGEHVGGHLYEVFAIRDGRIKTIRTYRDRAEALAAAGAEIGR